MRAAAQIGLVILLLVALGLGLQRLAPVAPALAGVARLLLHPLVLLLVVAGLLLLRATRRRKRYE